MHTDPPPPQMPDPVWPPTPRLGPPEAAPAARRTLTPLAWLDAVIGLTGGVVLAWLCVAGANLLLPIEGQIVSLGDLAVAALFCAACRVVGRRFPVLAVTAAVGALAVFPLPLLLLYWPGGR